MQKLVDRVFCSDCGAIRVHAHGSRYVVCPNGHGRLMPRFNNDEFRKAIAAKLPRAWRLRRNLFVIDGHDGRFTYRAGNGRRVAPPDERVEANEVIARYVTRARTLIRVFTKKTPLKARG
jgi:hypothetical protein